MLCVALGLQGVACYLLNASECRLGPLIAGAPPKTKNDAGITTGQGLRKIRGQRPADLC